MRHVLDNFPHTLREWLNAQGEPAYRAEQVGRWLFQRRAASFDAMTDLPRQLRERLDQQFHIWTTSVEKHLAAKDGTEKLLLKLSDGEQIECVLLRDGHRRTICISTQVGCAMGCVFCASGLDGVVRNLASAEILEQMLRLNQLPDPAERLSHVVVMGMGEPLANLENLLPALDQASCKLGLGISPRRITISTVGIPPGMRRLVIEGRQYNLAVSLHAPDDELRNKLVPVNRKIGLDEVLTAADEYYLAFGRRLTFEYVLLKGINDGSRHARSLARLLSGRNAMLNVIPYNPVAGLGYQTPLRRDQTRFLSILRGAGINVQVRERKGNEIDAACGQLRKSAQATPALAGRGT